MMLTRAIRQATWKESTTRERTRPRGDAARGDSFSRRVMRMIPCRKRTRKMKRSLILWIWKKKKIIRKRMKMKRILMI